MNRAGGSGCRRMAALALLWILLAASGLPGGASEGFELGYRFSEGSETGYKFEYSQEYEIKGYSYTTMIDLEYTERCTEVIGDSLYSMEMTVEEVSAQTRRNDELMDTGLEGMMRGQSFLYRITRNGKVSDIQAKGFIEKEKEVLGIIRVVLGGSYPYLPAREVGVGEKWTFEGSTVERAKTGLDVESSMEFQAKKTKKESGRNCMEVEGSGESYMSGRMENESGRYAVDGQGETKVKFYYDIEYNRVLKVEAESSAEMTFVEASESVGAERESMTTGITYKLKKELK